MNMILSVIVCFAMIFGGTGTMPAQPETAVTWTISNLTIEAGDEAVTLDPELRITTAAGSEKMLAHFEIGIGEQALIPASAEITADGVRFALGNTGHSYSISEDALLELAEMDEETLQMLGVFVDFFKSYGTVIGMAMHDMEFATKFSEVSLQALMDTCGTVEETEVEIEGVAYPAQQIHFELTGAAIMKMMDELAACGVTEVEQMIKDCLALVSVSSGEEITSFSAMLEGMEEDVSMPLDMVVAAQDDFIYESAVMDMTDEASGMAMAMEVESITRGEETEMTMSMSTGDDYDAMIFEMNAQMTGSAYAPTEMTLECGVHTASDYSYEAYSEEDEDYTSISQMAMFITMESSVVDGLGNMQMSIAAETMEEYGYGDDLSEYEESFGVDISCEETLEDDGSVTAAWAIGMNVDGETLGLAFDVNRTEGAVTDYFADTTEYALTAEVLASTEEGTPSQELMLLGTDGMSYVAEAYALTADESVMELIEMFNTVYMGEEYTETEVAEVEEVQEAVTVYSMEEAAEIYRGKIPEYTAPEGYELTQADVDSYSLCAYYADGENSFELYTYDSGAEGSSYYTFKDGVLTPAEGYVTEIYTYDDGDVAYAELHNADGQVSFYFYNMDMTEVEVVLAGLK